MQRVFGTFLLLECIYTTWYFPWKWNALTTKFTLFWSRCTLLCIEYQAGLSSSIEITDKLHRRGARQVACAGFAIVSKQNTEYCRWPSITMEVPQLLSWCLLYLYCICVWWENPDVVSYGHTPHCWSVDWHCETFAYWYLSLSETPVHCSILFYALYAHANSQRFTGQQF